MNDIRIRFRHLQCFLAIAHHRGVGLAAKSLAFSQPALSKTLRELESVLGVRLFERKKNGMQLTRSGEVFLQHAAASVAALRQGIDNINHSEASVTVAALPTVAEWLMPQAIRLFKQGLPETTVRVVNAEHAQLLHLLRVSDVDLVVGRLARPEDMVGLSFERLYSERLLAVVRTGHPLTKARRLKLAAIADYPCVLPPVGTVIGQEIDRFLVERGAARPRDAVETMSTTFGRAYTRLADAVWFVAQGIVETDLKRRRLVPLPIDTSAMLGPVGITMRGDLQPSAAVKSLCAAIRTVATRAKGEVAP